MKFQGEGDNLVETTSYDENNGRICINKNQFFEAIHYQMWKYEVGGYQVLQKWLKDRKGRRLLLEDIKTYCKIATAIQKTMEIQEEIDKLYPAVETNLIDFKESNQNADLKCYTK